MMHSDTHMAFRPLADAPFEDGGHAYIAWNDGRVLDDYGLRRREWAEGQALRLGYEFRVQR